MYSFLRTKLSYYLLVRVKIYFKNHFFPAIAVLDAELQKQVLANYEGLLSQATWVEKLEGVLAIMQSHVQVNFSLLQTKSFTQFDFSHHFLKNFMQRV